MCNSTYVKILKKKKQLKYICKEEVFFRRRQFFKGKIRAKTGLTRGPDKRGIKAPDGLNCLCSGFYWQIKHSYNLKKKKNEYSKYMETLKN